MSLRIGPCGLRTQSSCGWSIGADARPSEFYCLRLEFLAAQRVELAVLRDEQKVHHVRGHQVLLNTVKHFRTIQPLVYILGLAGGALFIVLLIREGAAQVGLAIARAGWGLLALVLYHQLQTLSDSAGWLVLIPK